MSTSTTTPLPVVSIEATSDSGFILTVQPVQNPPAPFVKPTKEVALDFPTMMAKLATIFGVNLPSTSISAAITAAASPATSALPSS